MSLVRRLHLDDVVTSFPELGPTIPDGGYSWVVLWGVILVQMTVPSVLSMYGIVLGYLARNSTDDFDIFNEKIVLTPILFTAFWSLADPWAKTIVGMASVPRLVGLIGVVLLSTGVVASGYLATGGVGAYLASLSAGAVMGIGASLVTLQCEHVLRKYFRRKLLLALTLKNVGSSLGLLIVPGLTYLLLREAGFKNGLLFVTTIFLPTALGTLTLRSPHPQRALPYRLLLSAEEDNELPIRISPDIGQNAQQYGDVYDSENHGYSAEERADAGGLLSEGSNMYSYQEPDEDVDLFVNPATNFNSKWKQQLYVLKHFQFWAAAIGWTGMKVSALLFWILLPTWSVKKTFRTSQAWMFLPILAGFITLIPNIASYKMLRVASRYRRIYFGLASCVGGVALIGIILAPDYSWMVVSALLGGVSIGCLSSCQELALYDVLGSDIARNAHKGFSTLVGLCVLIFCFVDDVFFCLLFVAILQFLGGLYWVSVPIVDIVKARRRSPSRTTNRLTRSQT